jgi:hypothetical protein
VTMSAEQRRLRLQEMGGRRAGAGATAVHRRAVLAGAPSRIELNRYAKRDRREAMALYRKLAFAGARKAGAQVVAFDADERGVVTVTYKSHAEAEAEYEVARRAWRPSGWRRAR